jgi:hypothetical protein
MIPLGVAFHLTRIASFSASEPMLGIIVCGAPQLLSHSLDRDYMQLGGVEIMIMTSPELSEFTTLGTRLEFVDQILRERRGECTSCSSMPY